MLQQVFGKGTEKLVRGIVESLIIGVVVGTGVEITKGVMRGGKRHKRRHNYSEQELIEIVQDEIVDKIEIVE